MKIIKRYKEFLENADGSATAGSGDVVSAQPGTLPGTFGTVGSGDVGFVFKKEKRKKGNPSEVTDMRDLAPAKGITKVEDIKESLTVRKRDPKYDDEAVSIINDCLVELYDIGFELSDVSYSKDRFSVDLDDEETGYFDDEELRISVHKMVNETWKGNIQSRIIFNKENISDKSTRTMRGTPMSKSEKQLSDICEEVALRMINLLDYQSGNLDIYWQVAGQAMPLNERRNININVHFILKNIIKH
jgi:hypothetical protein